MGPLLKWKSFDHTRLELFDYLWRFLSLDLSVV